MQTSVVACVLSVVLVAVSAPASAAGSAPAQSSSDALEEIVVTATRHSESLQTVPLSITAMSGRELEDRGITSYDDLTRGVPGVLNTGMANFNKVVIRGIQTDNGTSSIGEEKTVTLYLDDLPLTSFSIVTPDVNPYDLERVEVLRGPQGTLFGSGSMGGAIRYITNKPDLSRFGGSVDVDGGFTNGGGSVGRLNAMVNVPIVDQQLGLRVVGYVRNDGGWLDNTLLGTNDTNFRHDWGLRAALRWQPAANVKATLTYTDDNNLNGDAAFYDPALGVNKTNTHFPFKIWVDQKTVSGTLDVGLGWADLASSTTYGHSDSRWNLDLDGVLPGVPFFYGERIHTNTFVEDARLVSNGSGPVNWVAGLYYLTQNSDHRGALNTYQSYAAGLNITGLPNNYGSTFGDVGPVVDISEFDEPHSNLEQALYGEVSYRLTPTWKAILGVRASISDFTIKDVDPNDYDSTGAFLGGVFGGGNVAVPLNLTDHYVSSTGRHGSVTPKFSLQWEPSAHENYYLLVAEGFRRGQPNGLNAHRNGGRSGVDPNDPTVVPLAASSDSLWNYELGAKTTWFDNRLRTNAAVFLIDWSNIQVPLNRPSDGAPFVGNAGNARSYGLELEADSRLMDPLRIGLNLTLQRAYVYSLTPVQAVNSGAVVGARLVSPEVKIGAYVEYDWNLQNAGKLSARADYQYVGSYPNTFPNNSGAVVSNPAFKTVPSYNDADLTISWSRDQLRVAAYAQNVFNTLTPIFINASNYSNSRYETLRPRTVGLRVGWSY